ncbi:MAG: BMP family ABC transporter substrate-binding protein [Rhodospirillaceae bacterium]|nr:BMP family ABC transporter substrate-binding protein [Rhodospirillaceae bacterium]
MQRLILCLALCCLYIGMPGQAYGFSVAVLYNIGGKFDKSFNESAFRSLTELRAAKDLKITEYEPQADSERIPMLRSAASSNDLVIAIGFAYRDSLSTVAHEFPKTHFSLVDDIVDLPNVQSIRFKEHEGAFLAGVAAAMASRSHVIGFVGGMDSPLIRRFQAGYAHGARTIDPNIRIITRMIGTSVAAFSDPISGYLLAVEEIKMHADVVFAAAGGSGLGVLQAAEDMKVLAIGVDSDQTSLFPGTVLTSAVKNVGQIVAHVVTEAAQGDWSNGILIFGLKEDGMALASSPYNAALMTPEITAATATARSAILDGSLIVEDTPQDAAPPTVYGDF